MELPDEVSSIEVAVFSVEADADASEVSNVSAVSAVSVVSVVSAADEAVAVVTVLSDVSEADVTELSVSEDAVVSGCELQAQSSMPGTIAVAIKDLILL